MDAGGCVVGEGLGLGGGVHGEMILGVFGVEAGEVELLHQAIIWVRVKLRKV